MRAASPTGEQSANLNCHPIKNWRQERHGPAGCGIQAKNLTLPARWDQVRQKCSRSGLDWTHKDCQQEAETPKHPNPTLVKEENPQASKYGQHQRPHDHLLGTNPVIQRPKSNRSYTCHNVRHHRKNDYLTRRETKN